MTEHPCRVSIVIHGFRRIDGTAWLMATMLPLTGAWMPEAALTDSIDGDFLTSLHGHGPTSGNWMKTTSPSVVWAWSVMPIGQLAVGFAARPFVGGGVLEFGGQVHVVQAACAFCKTAILPQPHAKTTECSRQARRAMRARCSSTPQLLVLILQGGADFRRFRSPSSRAA